MRAKRLIVSNHRLSRFHRLALLWLTWFAGFLIQLTGSFTPETRAKAHRQLDKIERVIVGIAIIHAAQRCKRRRIHPFFIAPRLRATYRAMLGGRLRRQLRHADPLVRIERLRGALDAILASMCRRFANGITRRTPIRILPETQAAALLRILIAPALAPDSS